MVRYGIAKQFTHYKSQQRDLQCPRLAVGMLFLTVRERSSSLCSWNAAKLSCCCLRWSPHAHYFEMRARNKKLLATGKTKPHEELVSEGLNAQEHRWQTLPERKWEVSVWQPCPVEQKPQKDKHNQKESSCQPAGPPRPQ